QCGVALGALAQAGGGGGPHPHDPLQQPRIPACLRRGRGGGGGRVRGKIGDQLLQQDGGAYPWIRAERVQRRLLLRQRLPQVEVGRIVDAGQQRRGQRQGAQCAVDIVVQAQALLADRQQQFHFVQAQRLCAVAIRIGQLRHA